MFLVIPKTALPITLAEITTTLLDGGKLMLFKNDFVPDASSVLGDFTICDFGGYTDRTILAWGAPYFDPSGLANTIAPTETFTATNATFPQFAYGAIYTYIGGALGWAIRFDSPVGFGVAGDTLNLVPKYSFGGAPAPA